jgi:hypothetical protein
MNAELQALVLALDAVIEGRTGAEAKRLEALYQSRLADALERYPGLSRQTLEAMVYVAYRRWIRPQEKPPTLPPNA